MQIPVRRYDEIERERALVEEDLLHQPAVEETAEAEAATAAAGSRSGGPAPQEARREGGEPDYRDLYLRAMAEMANFRRRIEARANDQVKEERHRLLCEILEVADNLERALAHLDEPGLREGVALTWEGLQHFLEREGVTPIAALGQPFDPARHEAVAVGRGGTKPGHVVNEVQKGYRCGDRLLRPARVVVGG